MDEPLVISGLTPGNYTIEEVFSTPNEYVTTITGPVCGGNMVSLVANCPPTVVTIVNRKRLCRVCPRTCMCF